MSWEFDAQTGVYKDHYMSSKIREFAAFDATFAQFMEPERGYGKGKGGTVNITRVLQLPLATKVGELDRLPTGRAAVNTKAVTVSEWGFAVELTEFEENLTFFDIRNKQQRMLRDQMSLTMDKMSADALKTTLLLATPTDATTLEFVTDGSADSAAVSNLSIAHLRLMHDQLKRDQVAPEFRNGQYIGILSTRAARGLKNDPEYKDWLAPTTSEPLINGRLKDVEGFALFETNHQAALDDDIGTNGVLGEGVFFGQDHAFFATVMDPEIRAGMPEDLGRFRKVGWVGTIEAGTTWDTASTTRIISLAST